jgi:hypothetical protein
MAAIYDSLLLNLRAQMIKVTLRIAQCIHGIQHAFGDLKISFHGA